MATWKDLENHIKSEFEVLPNAPIGTIGILFPVGERKQQVFIRHEGNDRIGEWAVVLSPIGKVSAAKLKEITQAAYGLLIGGIVMLNDVVMISHSVALTSFDVNEISLPIFMVTASADRLEEEYTGKDFH